MPAVLDRPHPLVIQPARPAHRGQMALLLGPDLAGAASPARPRVDGRQRMGELVRVRPDHDHLHRPFVWLTTGEADLRRTTVTWGDATLLSSHAEGPRAAAGDTSFAGQTRQTTQASRVSPPPTREPTAAAGRHRPNPGDSDSDSLSHAVLLLVVPRGSAWGRSDTPTSGANRESTEEFIAANAGDKRLPRPPSKRPSRPPSA